MVPVSPAPIPPAPDPNGDLIRPLLAAAATAPDPLPLIEAAEALARLVRDEVLGRLLLAQAALVADPWPLVAAARALIPARTR